MIGLKLRIYVCIFYHLNASIFRTGKVQVSVCAWGSVNFFFHSLKLLSFKDVLILFTRLPEKYSQPILSMWNHLYKWGDMGRQYFLKNNNTIQYNNK